jgi:catechol 2,3-dioxygenase-like lactoylglutathione lyase family enzyme
VKTFVAAIWLASNFAAGAAFAQTFPPNEAGVTLGHLHLNSRDVEANKKIFVGMGGVALKIDGAPIDYVRFPGVMVLLNLPPGPPPSTGPSEGTVINHVGFWVPNVQDAVAHWKAAGVSVEPGRNGRTDQAYVVTADGLRVEILENKDQKVPIQSHHIHFYVPQAAIPDIQAWYVKNFGARPSMRGQNQAADIPEANLTFSKSDAPTLPTKGRILDHIGFDVTNLEAMAKKLESVGIKLDQPIVTLPSGTKLTFVHDPWGTNIELNERPHPL